ncbi:hypothetical protein POM88_022117 [Heracleum sosnowskyi]|uniref:PsbP C-terminal domain-containing protein n=1 Tax=Heracleum sosnowskyi TaxID=360622 RepID=A0AAD8IEF6_9APIA|nr:hypothetical protein POM88_022117 [Heracleum sosnowskyi]
MTCPSSSFALDDVIELEGEEFNEDIRNKDVAEEVVNQNPNDGDEKSKEHESEDVKEVNKESNAFQRRKRKKTSAVWGDFVVIKLSNGIQKAQCKYCSEKLAYKSGGPTTPYLNHGKTCLKKKMALQNQKRLQFGPAVCKMEIAPLSDGKYDHSRQREAVAHWILMHEKPFYVVEETGYSFMMKVNLPQFEKITRFQARTDCISVYEIEKCHTFWFIQVLICGGDWVRRLHGIKKQPKTHEDEEPVEYSFRIRFINSPTIIPYLFSVPQEWEEVPVSIADLGGTEIDLRFGNPKEGRLFVIVAPVLRFADNLGDNATIEKVGPPEKVISAFGPEAIGENVEGKVLSMEVKEYSGRKYYQFELEPPHALITATAAGNRLYLFTVTANGLQWKRHYKDLKRISDSFRVV